MYEAAMLFAFFVMMFVLVGMAEGINQEILAWAM
jgi:hypothetical protein